MAIVPDIADDMQYLDGLQALVLKVPGSPDVELLSVLDEPVTWKEMEASNGQVKQGDRLFVWPRVESDEPPLGAVLLDSNNVAWKVLAVLYKDLVETWEVGCRNLSIVASLDNQATVFRAMYTHADGGDAKPHWRTEASNVPARFQPHAEDAQIFLDAEYSKLAYRVIFAYPVPIELAGGEYRIKDSQGYYYRVVEYVNTERIDTLPVAIAVRVIEGSEYRGQSSDDAGGDP
jgi:hypothetical protein